MKFNMKDIGIFPLLLSLPFMFLPKVLGGDTQPWVLMAAIIAFATFRFESRVNRTDMVLLVLSLFCVLVYALRSQSEYGLLRHTYTFSAFLVFWVVCRREKGDYFPMAVKATIVVWFLVGLYQYLAINIGYEIYIPGRYVGGRGIPSLAIEPSYYSSISVLQLMYLLFEKKAKNSVFIACVMASVVMSGSLLGMVFLCFPVGKLLLQRRFRILFVLPLLIACDIYLASSQVTVRIRTIMAQMSMAPSGSRSITAIASTALNDGSFNLRFGHIYFTLWENLGKSLFFIGPVDFMNQYNEAMEKSERFRNTGSDYILPSLGEKIYGSGLLAVLFFLMFLKESWKTGITKIERLEKIGFVVACMMNPISISNIFLIMYATRKMESGSLRSASKISNS